LLLASLPALNLNRHEAAFSSLLRGNGLLIASSTSTILALTWGGVTYSWSSWKIIVPLAVGLVGLAFSFWFEACVSLSASARLFASPD
jgi:drug/metabolite transporter (DMT)-like permease